MKISLIHPSRGRAEKAFDTMTEWARKANIPNDNFEVEHILSADNSDPQIEDYKSLFLRPYNLIRRDNSSVVEATNVAARETSGDILIYLSDDFKCPENWGQLVIEEFKKYSGPTLIKVDDCLQNFHTKVLTIPMMNRDLYEKLGYFWHPGYKSMFCDEHLYWRSEKLGALKLAPHLKFPHEHPSNGKAPNDETYKRSAANWDQGKALFGKHKSMGFTE